MKKIFYFVSLLAVAVGCARVEEPQFVAPEYTLFAEVASTKTSLDDATGSMKWLQGDQVTVLAQDGASSLSRDFTLVGDEATSNGKFSGTISGVPAVAIYPANEGHDLSGDASVDVVLASSYGWKAGEVKAPMLASITNSEDLTSGTAKFVHMGGLIKVTYKNVPSSAKSFTFTAKDSKKIAGTFSGVSVSEPVLNVGSGTLDSVSFDFENASNEMAFYVPVPCGQFGFTVVLCDENGAEIDGTRKGISKASVSKGKYYILPVIELDAEVSTVSTLNVENINVAKAMGNGTYGSYEFDQTVNVDGLEYTMRYVCASAKNGTPGYVFDQKQFVQMRKTNTTGASYIYNTKPYVNHIKIFAHPLTNVFSVYEGSSKDEINSPVTIPTPSTTTIRILDNNSDETDYTVDVYDIDINGGFFKLATTGNQFLFNKIEVSYSENSLTALEDPSDILCTNNQENENSLTFTWTVNPSASGYQVKVDDGEWEQPSGNGSHTILGLIAGQTYKLYVKAIGDNKNYANSPGSKYAEGTTKESDDPGKTLKYTFETVMSSSNTAYATYYDVIINDISWHVPGNQNFAGYWRLGGKQIEGVNRSISSNVPLSWNIHKVVITTNGKSNNSLTVNSTTLHVYADDKKSVEVANFSDNSSWSVGTKKEIVFTKSNSNSWANCYYVIEFNVTNTTKTNYGIDLNKIEFYE